MPGGSPAAPTWWLMRSTCERFSVPVDTGLPFDAYSLPRPHVGDLNADGLDDLLRTQETTASTLGYHRHPGGVPDLLTSVSEGAGPDGYGTRAAFTYAALKQSGACAGRDAAAPSFPRLVYRGPLVLACTFAAANGIGGTYTSTRTYYNLDADLQGRGLLGFERVRSIDSRDALVSVDHFSQAFPTTGMPSKRVLYQSDGSTRIAESIFTLASLTQGSGIELRHVPYVSGSTARRWELDGAHNAALLGTTSTATLIDSFGTAYDVTTTSTEEPSANGANAGAAYTRREYHPTANLLNDTTNWCLGRPQLSLSIAGHSLPGGTSLTRTTSRAWDPVKCRVTQEVSEPGDGQLQRTRAIGYLCPCQPPQRAFACKLMDV